MYICWQKVARKSVKGGWCPELGYSTATCVLERSECPNDRCTPHLCFLFLKCLPFEGWLITIQKANTLKQEAEIRNISVVTVLSADNEEMFRYRTTHRKMRSWVQRKDNRCEKLCEESLEVRTNCPVTCDICCESSWAETISWRQPSRCMLHHNYGWRCLQ